MKWLNNYYKFKESQINNFFNCNKMEKAMEEFDKLFSNIGITAKRGPDHGEMVAKIRIIFSLEKGIFGDLFEGNTAFPNINGKSSVDFKIEFHNEEKKNKKGNLITKTNQATALYNSISYMEVVNNDNYLEILINNLIRFTGDWKGDIEYQWKNTIVHMPFIVKAIKSQAISIITKQPTDLYKIIYDYIINDKKAYKYLNQLKGTNTYDEILKYGNIDDIEKGSELGGMGFND